MMLVVPVLTEQEKTANRAKAKENLYQSGVPASQPGEPLIVAVPNPSAKVKGKVRWFYRVVYGDTQYGIAEKFAVDRMDLARWNGLDPEAFLHPRMVLQVWTSKNFSPKKAKISVLSPKRLKLVQSGSEDHLNIAEERIGRKRIRYSPKKPESLETIGRRFGLSQYDLSRINMLDPHTVVAPGESVLVYEVVDASASDRAKEQAKQARKRSRARK
jgi:LysM repeat protein